MAVALINLPLLAALLVWFLAHGEIPARHRVHHPVVELWSCDDCRRSFLREETHS